MSDTVLQFYALHNQLYIFQHLTFELSTNMICSFILSPFLPLQLCFPEVVNSSYSRRGNVSNIGRWSANLDALECTKITRIAVIRKSPLHLKEIIWSLRASNSRWTLMALDVNTNKDMPGSHAAYYWQLTTMPTSVVDPNSFFSDSDSDPQIIFFGFGFGYGFGFLD
jgi:hypothetical protein